MQKGQKQEENLNDKIRIKEMFLDWQKNEIKEGHFFAKDSCNPQWFIDHKFDGTINEMFGIPESDEITFSFADLNNDGKLDGLVMFTPEQCDGGNASMWTQFQVFFLSQNNNYKILDTLEVGKFASSEFDSLGFYWLDSIGTNKIFGTYCEFKDNDGHFCPHQQNVIFDFTKRKLTFISDYIKRK